MIQTNDAFRVELLRNIPHLHLAQGDILMCTNSGWDPEKVKVLHRESDGWDPECNLYRCDVRMLPLAGTRPKTSMSLKLLDGFCCQGGASMGYHQVGFIPYGIDISPQRHYPFPFHQGDVIQVLATLNAGGAIDFTHKDGTVEWLTLDQFVASHMSPPCQAKTKAQKIMARKHPRLIAPTRELLIESGLPYVIENVVPENEEEDEDPLIEPIELCGAMFGLGTYRHRLFESNMPITAPEHPAHTARNTKMGRPPVDGEFMHVVGNFSGVEQAKKAMGISWMTRDGLRESIPPAYTEHIGRQLMAQLVGVAA